MALPDPLMPSFATLADEIPQAMHADRRPLRRLLRSIESAAAAGKPFDRNLAKLEASLRRSVERRQQRQAIAPQEIVYDDSLPIAARREEIARAIAEHQVVVVCGETGSGKSTQIPKICLELGRGVDGAIGHTQPRRIAARSIAARLAEELSVPLGEAVGYKIRFTDVSRPTTLVKVMTDGILLAESQSDRFFDQYDTIILDEAHERSLNIDFLLGCLKRILPQRPDLRVIITSATLDAARFAEHFSTDARPAPAIEVSGRTYPVEVRYRPLTSDDADVEWEAAVADAVEELAAEGPGDMLVFLPTERHIREAARVLRGRLVAQDATAVEILPLYARLSGADQSRVFEPHRGRRIVLATNVAESSLTVPGIHYVVDLGTARISRYSPKSKVQRLPIEPVSQASADQRKGRCGRIGPGICARLYSEDDYLSRERYTTPEIQRTNLASVILQTKALNLGPIEEFPFLDPPRPDAIRDGYKTLFELRAIDEQEELTDLGRRLARLPIDPRVGRMILAADHEGCLAEALIIAAALEVQDPRERPVDRQQAADEKHAQWAHPESDFLAYLKLWDFYHKLREDLSKSQLRKACRENFLSYNRMREWLDVHRQLLQLVAQSGLKTPPRKDEFVPIHRALLAGLLSSVAMRGEGNEYIGAGGGKFYLWPGSGVFASRPKWIVAAELVETSRRYLRTVARIDPVWIERLADHLIKRSYAEPHWSGASGQVMAFETVTLFGLPVVARRRIPYGPIDPKRSRELFIRHGLVEGDLEIRARFLEHNEKVLQEVLQRGAKLRRNDYVDDEQARLNFYHARVPEEVWSARRFEQWRRRAERESPQLLYMTVEDLLTGELEEAPPDEYPDALEAGPIRLPLEYHFEPGAESDGVTVTLPKEGLAQLPAERLGWLVPGLLEARIISLIKTLPKPIRRNLVPAPDVARKALAEMRFGQGPFLPSLSAALRRVTGEFIPVEAFEEEKLAPHLRINIRVVDEKGKEVAQGRDLGKLREEIGAEGAASVARLETPQWRRDGIKTWDFGELPAEVSVEVGGITLPAFPALVDRGDSVSLQLEDSAEKADEATRGGLRRLFFLAERRDLKTHVAWLPRVAELTVKASGICPSAAFHEQLALLIAGIAFVHDRPIPRSEEQFRQRLAEGRGEIGPAVQEAARLVAPLIDAYHEARLAIDSAGAPAWSGALDDMRRQLAGLTPPDFLTTTPWRWLKETPRYLRAMVQRIDKLKHGAAARDEAAMAELGPRQRRCFERRRQNEQQGVYDPQLELYRWMLEEFRVSLFAQELGTSMRVSAKRLDKQWESVRE